MINLRDGLTQYVALRRALGTKLQEPAITLGRFLDFLEGEKSRVYYLRARASLGHAAARCATCNLGPTAWHGEGICRMVQHH